MIKTIYFIILMYFLLGGVAFYLINRNKPAKVARDSYTKLGMYFLIIHLLFFSIALYPITFPYLIFGIIIMGYLELSRVYFKSGIGNKGFFAGSILIFTMFSLGLLIFSRLDPGLILYTFLVLSIFDSFSQISGQLWGRKQILPRISPNKTAGGLTGGALIALASGILLRRLYPMSGFEMFFLTMGIIIFAFLGDVAASYYKRVFSVKDYSRFLPGHGGFLDRFDSLIAGGCWVALWNILNQI